MSEKVTIKVERKKLHLPTIALRGLVVFPNNLVHFEVGREKSIAAVEWAMANNSNVFLVAQKEMELSDPTQEDLFAYGVVAEVKQVLRVSDDLVKVLVEGKYRAKLTARMEEVLQSTTIDPQRILMEAAIYADKVAVDEETVRLRSHVAQLRTMLESDEPMGRKMDFLIQEVNRESNTIGSKCNDVAIANVVVGLKAEVEKMREQVQNVE